MDEKDLPDMQIPLADVIDLEILMHRDVHFGANFDIMIDYYKNKGVGVMPDFSLKRMKELKELEEKMEKNLSEVLLPVPAKETIERAKKIYLDLRDIYHRENPSEFLLFLSNLILSEEEVPHEEMKALVAMGKDALPRLVDLVKSDVFYDPLYPGYGRSPIFAAKCLAEIGDPSAMAPLFEALGRENFYTDDEIIKALCSFGGKAKTFLLSILKKTPYSKDNDHAAIVLIEFSDDLEVIHAFLELLSNEEVQKRTTLAPYLIFGCTNLTDPNDQKRFKEISKSPHLTKELKDEMHAVLNAWEKLVKVGK